MKIHREPTPNPVTIRFELDRSVMEQGSDIYTNRKEAARHPLAGRLFECPGIKLVFLIGATVCISVEKPEAWEELTPRIEAVIHRHFERNGTQDADNRP